MAASASHSRTARREPKPTVLLVDDHDLFRAGLRNLLEGSGLRVVGDSRCGPGAVDIVRRTHPSVVVLDAVTDRGASTAPYIRQIASEPDPPSVIVFAGTAEDRPLYECIRAGATGYLTKDTPVDLLVQGIHVIDGGEGWLLPSLTATVLKFIRTGLLPMPLQSEMSDREVEVLRAVARGLDNNEIAAELGISAKTVKNHVSNIFMKLGLTNRVQAATYAIRTGLV